MGPMEPDRNRSPGADSSSLRRYGPIAVVIVLIAGVAAVSLVDRDGGEETGGDTTTTTLPPAELPEGVITWSMAEDQDLDVDFPDTCDTDSGMIAIPFYFCTECFADVADNGGATAPGVTGDTIKIVAWIPAEDDPLRSLLLERIGLDATNAEIRETYEGYVEIFRRHYQTYGREVELDFVEASGSILDNTAARADAVRAAEELGAFAVLGGPVIGSAWTDELHARGVVCIACPGISDSEPSVFSVTPTSGQVRTHLVEYVSKKLAGGQAEFAGEDLQGEDRVFGHLALGMSDSDERNAEQLTEDLAENDVEVVEQILYPLDPGRAAELATNAVTRMKSAGVTTVMIQADPILLPAFTQEATKQEWFPEWVLGGSPFIDTTTFARTFDQQQWEHAFGISYFPPQVDRSVNPPAQLYEWFHGESPPIDAVLPLLLIYPQVALFFTGLEYAGPDLTVETFRDGLFVMPPFTGAVTQPTVSYGESIWPSPDYAGIDDMVELWWDPDATGTDEGGEQGEGMYRYVAGAQRYLPGEHTDEVAVFDPAGSVAVIEEIPADEVPPDYPSPGQ